MFSKLAFKEKSFSLNNITPRAYVDAVKRVHFRAAPLESYAARRFAHLVDVTLRGELRFQTQACCVAWSLICFDAIATRQDLLCALPCLAGLYTWQNHLCLDWRDADGRQQRRHLSVFTQAALASGLPAKIDAAATLTAIDTLLADFYPTHPDRYTLDILLADARAWFREHLPEPLYAHVAGWVPMSSLPRTVLAREETRQALMVDNPQGELPIRPEGFQVALGAYLSRCGQDHGNWLIAELVGSCRRNKTLDNAQDRKRMLESCLGLAQRAEDAGPINSLILAWAIDLLESGTRRKSQIRAVSASKYIGSAADRLLIAFRGQDIEAVHAEQFLNIYQQLLDGLSSSQARTLASALSSWHFFLSTWFEVEPLKQSLHKWLPKTAPKANLLWPHEVDRIRSWLAQEDVEQRLARQLRVAFEILATIRIRASELLNLRLQNISIDANAAHIEIATAARDGGLKSEAARRVQTTDDPATVAVLREWIRQRHGEGAYPVDYLFGDPYRPDKKYRSGQRYVALNRVLKAVTGDMNVASHALSHTHVSLRWLEATRKRMQTDINPFEQLASEAGHESPHTGFSVYFHFGEVWLRESLDKIFEAHLHRWPAISNWVGVSHDAFRQARCRWLRHHPGADAGQAALHLIRQAMPAPEAPNTARTVPICTPEKPQLFGKQSPLSLAKTLDLLNDIQFGHGMQAIALRCDLSTTHVAAVAEIARHHLEHLVEGSRHAQPATGEVAVALLHEWLNPPGGRRIDFSRTGQGKVVDLYDFLNRRFDADSSQAGIRSWQDCYRRGYLSLESPSLAAAFTGLLDAAEVPRSLLIIRSEADLESRTLAHLQAIFRTGIVAQPSFETVRPRYGRPSAYLLIASHLPASDADHLQRNAAVGMSGIHALFLAAAVCRDFNAAHHERNPNA